MVSPMKANSSSDNNFPLDKPDEPDKKELEYHALRNDLATIINNLLYYKNFLPEEAHEFIDEDIRRCEKVLKAQASRLTESAKKS